MELPLRNLFKGIEDPRVEGTKKHPLESILYIVLCGTIAGIDSWIGYQDYAEEHEDLLKEFIDLPHGIPSHDTLARVIESLNVDAFLKCFKNFTQTFIARTKGVISLDGKTIKRSFDKAKGIKARHIVSAWAQGCKLVLGQERADDKSNEITAIPQLLRRLDLQGQIVDQQGDYVIALKGNQGTLHKDVDLWFKDQQHTVDHMWEEWDKGHGRIEHRLCQATNDIAWLQEDHNWPGLQSIAAVQARRETAQGIQTETRYYITSLPADAERIAKAARDHWGIENSLHWVLDVTMNEDKSRIRNENAPEILSIMRKWGLNIINQTKGDISVKRMIQKMAMSPKNLLLILQKI